MDGSPSMLDASSFDASLESVPHFISIERMHGASEKSAYLPGFDGKDSGAAQGFA